MKDSVDSNSHRTAFAINTEESTLFNLSYLKTKYKTIYDSDEKYESFPFSCIKKVYVSPVKKSQDNSFEKYHPCFISDFSMFIKDVIENNYVSVVEESIDVRFFQFISKHGSLISRIYGLDDDEIVEIYAKQIIILMKKLNAIYLQSGRVKINENFDWSDYDQKIIKAFWEYPDWSELFPSLPDVAKKVSTNIDQLKEIMLGHEYPQYIDKLSIEFFNKTSIYMRNEMLLISFLDFSVFSWLSLLGIINYIKVPGNNYVMIELTSYGRKVLSEY